MTNAARFLLIVNLAFPTFAQQISYSLYSVPFVGSPKQIGHGINPATPDKIINITKSNSPQSILQLDDRFSLSFYMYPTKNLESLHIGFDDKTTTALATAFFVRELGNIFRVSRKSGNPRIRVYTIKVGDLEQPAKIEFLDNFSMQMDSGTSFLRSVFSILPGCNGHNYLLNIAAGSSISFVP